MTARLVCPRCKTDLTEELTPKDLSEEDFVPLCVDPNTGEYDPLVLVGECGQCAIPIKIYLKADYIELLNKENDKE